MIYQKRVPVIVMLTRLEEKNRVKADIYWPEDKDCPRQWGKMLVELKQSKHILPTITRRTFLVRHVEKGLFD